VADVRAALAVFGAPVYYGLRLVELVPAPEAAGRLSMGCLAWPGHVLLYDQPPSPWRLGAELPQQDRGWLTSAGADVTAPGVVTWPGDTLRRFMLGYVLSHEVGHHMLQHERRLRGERGARRSDHEARAEVIAARLRSQLTWH
jgi:hypothetical protein